MTHTFCRLKDNVILCQFSDEFVEQVDDSCDLVMNRNRIKNRILIKNWLILFFIIYDRFLSDHKRI